MKAVFFKVMLRTEEERKKYLEDLKKVMTQKKGVTKEMKQEMEKHKKWTEEHPIAYRVYYAENSDAETLQALANVPYKECNSIFTPQEPLGDLIETIKKEKGEL